jgi:hypothetical protein
MTGRARAGRRSCRKRSAANCAIVVKGPDVEAEGLSAYTPRSSPNRIPQIACASAEVNEMI